MMRLKPNTWVLIADGGRARIFRCGARTGEIEELHDWQGAFVHTPSRALLSDASGRAFDVRGPSAHARQPRSDAHELEEVRFIERVVRYLERAARQQRFETLVISAAPRTLGRLRHSMSPALAKRVAREFNLDLTALASQEIDSRIRAHLAA